MMDRQVFEDIARPRAILFDWDNTLVENWLAVQAAFNAALAEFGRPPLDLEQIKFQARHSSRDVFPVVFGDAWDTARKIFYEHFAANHLAGLRIMPAADALLDAVAEARLPMGIVSNKRGDLLRREIAHLGWTDRFMSVVGSQDAAADKPHPASVHLALSGLGVMAAPDIWLVGDTDVDMSAAVAAGCLPVLVGSADRTLPRSVEPALRCHNCKELTDFFRSRRATISET